MPPLIRLTISPSMTAPESSAPSKMFQRSLWFAFV